VTPEPGEIEFRSGLQERFCPSTPARSTTLAVEVIFTSTESTRAALEAASRLTRDLDAQVRLVAAQVVPYPVSLSRPTVPVEWTERHLRALAAAASVPAHVQVYLCRDQRQALADFLRPGSLVVLGGRRRWWPTAEQRLGRWLQARGHSVVFAVPAAADKEILVDHSRNSHDDDQGRGRYNCHALVHFVLASRRNRPE
jgi:hypothetical protein